MSIKVLLSCGAGMSSGYLAQRTRKVAKKYDSSIRIFARSESEIANYLSEIDLLLLGPHFENQLDYFNSMAKNYNVPVHVIPQKIYSMLDGEALYGFIIENLK